jgi:hypothetical protein
MGIMYYIRIWRPDEATYTVMKSASVIAETLGIDTAEMETMFSQPFAFMGGYSEL